MYVYAYSIKTVQCHLEGIGLFVETVLVNQIQKIPAKTFFILGRTLFLQQHTNNLCYRYKIIDQIGAQ